MTVQTGNTYSTENPHIPGGVGRGAIGGGGTAIGTVQSLPANVSPTSSFAAKFRLESQEGRIISFPASSTVTETAFSVQATLTWADDEDLTGRHDFGGTLGGGNFSMTLDNNVTITGPMTGGPAKSQEFAGSGFWAISES